ncbi:MAG: desulfoferrodoxin family protein [Planctomycetota bacterium]|jgi:superoxide reductase
MPDTATSTIQCQENLFCGINTVKNPSNPTDLEKKHLPVITAPQSVKKGECFEVTIEVGKLMQHPNEPGHYIDFIELYADHTYLGRFDFTPRMTCPVVKTCLALDHIHSKLRAFGHCNLHGTWEGDTEIQVSD